jgi:hypothetical protein
VVSWYCGIDASIPAEVAADAQATRASVPQNSQGFVDKEKLSVKKKWIKHPGPDDSSTIYALGIRSDRGYLQGDEIKGEGSPTVYLRAKTLIHEATHRFANTKDHAYFKDNGEDLDTSATAPTPPAQSETERWLDNADSHGWFCIALAVA